MKRWIPVIVVLLASGCPEDREANNVIPGNNPVNNASNTPNNTTNNSSNNATNNATNNPTNNASNNAMGYGESIIAMDEDCEGIAGLNGDALIADTTDTLIVTMADVDADTDEHTNPRELTIGITWPNTPEATCYPEYFEDPATIQPRLAIWGVTITATTTDGEFSESFEGAAWLSTNNGTVGSPSVAGGAEIAEIAGSYMPGDEVLFPNPYVSLFTTLSGPLGARGNFAMSAAGSVKLSYGSFTGRQIVISWPYEP